MIIQHFYKSVRFFVCVKEAQAIAKGVIELLQWHFEFLGLVVFELLHNSLQPIDLISQFSTFPVCLPRIFDAPEHLLCKVKGLAH